MTTRKVKVETYLILYVCPCDETSNCERQDGLKMSNPLQYRHVCNKCKKEYWLDEIYPKQYYEWTN